MSEPLLSILIPSLPNRIDGLTKLVKELDRQIRFEAAEGIIDLVVNIDNKHRTTGEKRNWLLKQAKGKHVVFIDCDDWIPDYYIWQLLKALRYDVDCIGICGVMTTDGAKHIGWELSKDFKNETVTRNNKPFYLRTTNHISPVRRSIALQAMFPEISNAEDKAYSDRILPLLKTERKVPLMPMYYYQYSTKNKEYK